MLGRKTFTPDELDRARSAVREQLETFRTLAAAVEGSGPEAGAALAVLERVFFTNLVLALDRRFVHRVRPVSGKDGNPLNEVELFAESLIDHDGVLQGNKVIRYVPGDAVLGIEPGGRISLDADGFERLAEAFLAELETRFVAAGVAAGTG